MQLTCLPGGTGEVGGDDIGRVPVQAAAGPVIRIVVRGSACDAASCTSRSGTPASKLTVINACRSVYGVTVLLIPGVRGGLADGPPGAMPVEPPSVRGRKPSG